MAYVPRLSQVIPTPMWQNRLWYADNGFYLRGYGLPNCTCYAFGRAMELNNGRPVPGLTQRGAGGQWYDNSPSLQAGNNPNTVQLGDILCFYSPTGARDGHVSVIEVIDRTASRPYIKVSESGWRKHKTAYPPDMDWYFHVGTHYFDTGFIDGWVARYGYELRGIIRFLSDPGTPSYPMPTAWISKPNLYSMTEEDKQNNAIMTYIQLNQAGWTLNAIAGYLGNANRESNIDPDSSGSGGYGLVGWTPPSNYTIWADYMGYSHDDGRAQTEFVDMGVYCTGINPLTGPVFASQWVTSSSTDNLNYPNFKLSTKSPEDLARIFMHGYERPNARYARLDLRQQWARKWYNFLQGIDPTVAGPFITVGEADKISRKLLRPVYYPQGRYVIK